MIFKRTCLLLIFLFFVIGFSQSQSHYSIYIQDFKKTKPDTSKLFLHIDNNNFVKNNEYFGSIAEGYTLLGTNLAPKIVYSPSSKLKLSAGGNFLAYYGRENEVDARLLLSFQYKIHPYLDFILGNIYGSINHKLIEPLLDPERFLTKNIENGIQFLWNNDRIYADLWLDWEQQILQGDPFQEKFNVGLSSEFFFIENNHYKLSIPFQNLIRHEGGQINSNNDEPLTTIYNNATGIRFWKQLDKEFIQELSISSFWVNYQDLSPQNRQMYIDGMGSYSSIDLSNKKINVSFGYWYGEQYIAPIGNPLFESYSRTKFYVEEPIRQLAIGKLTYHEEVFKNIHLGAHLEGFYDILGSNFEYTWAVVVVFNDRFFLKGF